MKYNLELNDLIGVPFDKSDFDKSDSGCLVNKDQFIQWIRKNRGKNLAKIKEFTYWSYMINDEIHHFSIERGEDDNWHVHKADKREELYFSFTCNTGNNFIKAFEKGLIRKLDEENFDPYSFPSPDYPAQIDL